MNVALPRRPWCMRLESDQPGTRHAHGRSSVSAPTPPHPMKLPSFGPRSLFANTLLATSLRPLLAGLALSCVSSVGFAQWRSTLYPSTWSPPTTQRFDTDKLIQDFSYAGYRRGETPLPVISGPIYNVVTSYGADPTGANDSTVAIQNAINAAGTAGGGVVYLPAGTFKVKPQGTNTYALRIATRNIVLRGAGKTQTFLFNDSYAMRSKHIIRVEGATSSWGTVPTGSPTPTITSDLLTPTTSIPVSSVAGFVVGDWIIVRADATDAFVTEHNMGDLWAGLSSNLGGVMFHRQITAIDAAGLRLTIDTPTRYYLKTRDNARVHKAVAHIDEVGLENFAIGNREHASSASSTGWGENEYNTTGTAAYDVHDSSAIMFRRARQCWILNVVTYRPAANTLKNSHLLSNGIQLNNCRFVTVRGCDFQRPLYGGGGGNGYMYRLPASNECLIESSTARYNRHGFVISHMQSSGNVIRGGLAQVTRTQAVGSGTTSGEGCDHHAWLSHSNLIDTMQLDRDFFTSFFRGTAGSSVPHGQTGVHTVFWNLEGLAYQSNKSYIVRTEQARYGYAIGTRGSASGISTLASGGTRTSPVDHVEGAGIGSTVQPFSLHADQLSRRLVLPAPWSTRDVGTVAVAGSASHTGGRFTVNGSGTGIGGTADAYRYLYHPAAADCSIVARVAFQQNTPAAGQAGVLMRNSVLTPGSVAVSMVLTPQSGAVFQYRSASGGTTTTQTLAGITPPYWVRLVRTGTTFTGSVSGNGTTWTQVGSVTISLGTNTYVGMAVSGRTDGVLSQALFDNVSWTGAPWSPSNLVATRASSTQINLTWNDGSHNETQFRIERKVGTGSFAFLVNKSANATTHSDTGLTTGTTYTYRVRAENATGVSGWSAETSAIP